MVEKQCARPFVVVGEKARVHNLLGIAFWYTIAQNDGGQAPIILSYRMYFCAASMVVHACHFAPHRC